MYNQIYRNNKKGTLYEVVDDNMIDCTNSSNNKRMVLYIKYSQPGRLKCSSGYLCREYKEFLEKFTKVKEIVVTEHFDE